MELRDRGFTVIPDAGFHAKLLAAAAQDCSTELGRLHDAVNSLGIDAVGQNYELAEICTRHEHRFDLRPSRESAWTALVGQAVAVASPVIEHLHAVLDPRPDDSSPVWATRGIWRPHDRQSTRWAPS